MKSFPISSYRQHGGESKSENSTDKAFTDKGIANLNPETEALGGDNETRMEPMKTDSVDQHVGKNQKNKKH